MSSQIRNGYDASLSRDELILNFKQTEEESRPTETLLPIWHQVWNRFEVDICSYISPAPAAKGAGDLQAAEQVVGARVGGPQRCQHSFSLAYSERQLKRVILIHSRMDILPEIRKEVTRIFYKIANYFVVSSLKASQENLFMSAVEGYSKILNKFEVLIGCLNSVLYKFIMRKGIEDELHSIINKELMNHPSYEGYVDSCMSAV
jgi:hypothetical protein